MRKLILILMGLFLIGNTSAWSNDTFNNSLTSEILTFTGNQNITRYLAVPSSVGALTTGYFDLTGYLPEGEVKAYYKMDETSGAIAHDLLGKYNATTSGMSWNASGILNGSGNSTSANAFMNTTFSMGGNKSGTINFWFKASSSEAGGNTIMCIDGGNWNCLLGAVSKNGDLGLFWNSSTSFKITRRDNSSTNTTYIGGFTANVWHMVTIIVNETHTTGYIDGVRTETLATYGWVFNKTNTINPLRTTAITGVNLIDEIGIWNKTLNTSEMTNLYNGGLASLPDFNIPASIFLGNDEIIPSISSNGTIPLTVKVSNLSRIINPYLNSTYLVGSNYLIPFIFHSDVSGTLNYSNMLFNNLGFFENSQTYTTPTTSQFTNYFSINLTYDSLSNPAISANLFYNNTNYLAYIITGTGDNKVFNVSVPAPTVTAQTNVPFKWIITLIDSIGGISSFNSTNYTQRVNPFQADNCAVYTSQILNFTLFDEDSRAQLNGTIELDVTFYQNGINMGTYNTSYAFTAGSTPLKVCINDTIPLIYDYHARYYSNVSLYPIEHKFGQNTSTSVPQIVSLYNLIDARSTPFQILLQSADLSSISGAIVDIQREYVPLALYTSVETPLTDVYGTTLGHFVSEEVYYTFIVTKNGELLGTFPRQLVRCQNVVTGDCRITLNLIQASPDPTDFSIYGGITSSYIWTPLTRTLMFIWATADGSVHTVGQNVTFFDNWGNNTICSNSASGVSGTYTCVVPASYGNQSILSSIYSDGVFLGKTTYSLSESSETIFGGTKVVLAITMYSTLALMLIANPITLIIGAILGMAFVGFFHIVDGGSFIGNSSIIMWFVVAGGIIIYQLAKKK